MKTDKAASRENGYNHTSQKKCVVPKETKLDVTEKSSPLAEQKLKISRTGKKKDSQREVIETHTNPAESSVKECSSSKRGSKSNKKAKMKSQTGKKPSLPETETQHEGSGSKVVYAKIET